MDTVGCSQCTSAASTVCSRCLIVRYCSRKCQSIHWPQHRFECEIRNQQSLQTDTIQTNPIQSLQTDTIQTNPIKSLQTNPIQSQLAMATLERIEGNIKIMMAYQIPQKGRGVIIATFNEPIENFSVDTFHIVHLEFIPKKMIAGLSMGETILSAIPTVMRYEDNSIWVVLSFENYFTCVQLNGSDWKKIRNKHPDPSANWSILLDIKS